MSLFLGVCLFFCVLWALMGPLVSPWIEKRLEWFILVMGALAATISWSWSEAVVIEAIMRPMKVCGAVLAGSLIFSFSHDNIRRAVRRAMERIGARAAVGLSVIILGFAAGFLTKAVAVLTLVEILHAMRLKREAEMHVSVLGCFAIGLGGGLMPIGGPVPAIAVAKLADAYYPVDAYYLANLMGPWVVPAVIAVGIVAGALFAKPLTGPELEKAVPEDPLSLWSILLLSSRLYIFIGGLVLLGAGLVPIIDRYLLDASPSLLYWMNSISAVVDGATLASVEISSRMSQEQTCYILIGILIAGGGLVTGSAHNIIAAHKLEIKNREWAKIGLPTAAVLMTICFLSLLATN